MADHHRRAPKLPKRHRQTGLDVKGVNIRTTKTVILLFQNQ
jgi:hypothetical protein